VLVSDYDTLIRVLEFIYGALRDEIAAIEAEIWAGNPDLQGLCLALSDWSEDPRRAAPRVARSSSPSWSCRAIKRELDNRQDIPGVTRFWMTFRSGVGDTDEHHNVPQPMFGPPAEPADLPLAESRTNRHWRP